MLNASNQGRIITTDHCSHVRYALMSGFQLALKITKIIPGFPEPSPKILLHSGELRFGRVRQVLYESSSILKSQQGDTTAVFQAKQILQ